MVSEAGSAGTNTGWTCSNFWICQIQKRLILWWKRDFERKSINISSVASVSDPIGWLAAAEVSPKGSWLQPNRVLSEYGCNQSAPRRSAVATEGGSAAPRQIYNVLCDSHKRETAICKRKCKQKRKQPNSDPSVFRSFTPRNKHLVSSFNKKMISASRRIFFVF